MISTLIIILLAMMSTLSRGLADRRYIDLTHTFDSNAPKWPLPNVPAEKYFKRTDVIRARLPDYWVAFGSVEYFEHVGTHIDAPIHAAEGRQGLKEIPVDKLIGPGVVIDIKNKAKVDHDYAVTVEDIQEHETKFGRIPDNSIVIINSGWGLYYPTPNLVFGTSTPNDSSTFHFPGYSLESAKFLLTQRYVKVVGTDTPSIDIALDKKFTVHAYLQSLNVPLLEYIANLDSIPQTGTTIFIGAPKFRDGTGGHSRLLAIIGDEGLLSNDSCKSTGVLLKLAVLVVHVVLFNPFPHSDAF